MVSSPPSKPGALVIDANITIALAAKETGRETTALAEMARYAQLGYLWFAPGVIIAETLYILCGKKQRGELASADYTTAVLGFQTTMTSIHPPPIGDRALIARAEQIGDSYGCSRSADGIYIALAEELSQTGPTVLLTFDRDMPNPLFDASQGVCILVGRDRKTLRKGPLNQFPSGDSISVRFLVEAKFQCGRQIDNDSHRGLSPIAMYVYSETRACFI
jgi:predicted nucleic acid-binding protein